METSFEAYMGAKETSCMASREINGHEWSIDMLCDASKDVACEVLMNRNNVFMTRDVCAADGKVFQVVYDGIYVMAVGTVERDNAFVYTMRSVMLREEYEQMCGWLSTAFAGRAKAIHLEQIEGYRRKGVGSFMRS